MSTARETFFVAGVHSENAPPAYFETPICLSFDSDTESFIKRVFDREEESKTYTVGYRDNSDHVWKIVDYAITAPDKSSKTHPGIKYLILYYEPVNIDAVIRDCLPHLLDVPNDFDSHSSD